MTIAVRLTTFLSSRSKGSRTGSQTREDDAAIETEGALLVIEQHARRNLPANHPAQRTNFLAA
jgi:hypothetical protein